MNIIQKNAIFSCDDNDFDSCHASTSVISGSDLLIAYFAGIKEGHPNTAIWLTRYSDRQTWLPPVKIADTPGVANWNPVLHNDHGVLWLFFKAGNSVHQWTTFVTFSTDNGYTWTQAQPLVPNDKSPRGPVKNKLLVLSNGDWLAPASTEGHKYWDAFVDLSVDGGKHWQKIPVPFTHIEQNPETCDKANGTWKGLAEGQLWETDPDKVFQWDGIIQPTLWESGPGMVHMLLRSTRGVIFRSDSGDFGRTWCQAYPTSLPNNNSGIDVVSTGRQLVLAFNPVKGNWLQRCPLTIATSNDNGISWKREFDLETSPGEYSYPAIIFDHGQVHLTYTWNRKCIVYCLIE